ncbi:MAG: hypothetical protein GY829_09965 [Gammaproteobacteria bacterium]|nr:hypothetical protein [Gammaproteobacteria bacterium]
MVDFYDIILKFELALPFLLLSIYLSIVVFGRKKQDRKSLQKLVSIYKEKEESRKKTVIEFLKNKVGLDEPASEETSKKILEARKSFVQKVIYAFLSRKEESISNLDNELSLIIRAYQELSISVSKEEITEEVEDEPKAPQAAEAIAKDVHKASEDLTRLKKENKNLKIEMHTTLSTLNNIFAEYTSMFGEESDSKDMSVDEILTAMESFGADQIEAAASTDDSAENLMMESQTEPKPKPKEEAKPEVKVEEPVAEAKVEEPVAEAEPSWDEAFEEAEAKPEAEVEKPVAEAEVEKPVTEAEPSWDEAFEEAEAKPEAKVEEPVAEAKVEEPVAEVEVEKPVAEAEVEEPVAEAKVEEREDPDEEDKK